MLPLAHIASALVANKLAGVMADVDDGPAPAVLGALLPDAIDKSLAWVFRVAPVARYAGHTLIAVAAAGIAGAALKDGRWGRALAVAYGVHLLGDLWQHGHVPWLMPFKRYEEESEPWAVRLDKATLVLEVVGAAVIAVYARDYARERDGARGQRVETREQSG